MGHESITSAVRGILRRNPQVCECLAVINYSRLAAAMRPDVERATGARASKEAVKTAIRRFADTFGREEMYEGVKSVLKGGRLNLRSNVSVIAVYPSMHATEKITRLEHEIDRRKGEILHIIAGINCIVLILDDPNFRAAEKIMGKDILSAKSGLAAITITTSLTITNTPGVVAYITTLLSRNSINIEEVSSCYTDTIIIVKKAEAVRTYNLLEDAMGAETMLRPVARKKKFGREPVFAEK